MATKVEIDNQSFCERLKYFYDCWKASKDDTSSWNGADSIVINVGESEDVVSYQKSISLHIWLFGYEFPETVLLFNSSSLKILTSQKKVQILKTALTEKAVVPIEFVVRTQDVAKDIKPLLDSISKSNEGKTYGILAKEKPKGKFIESWLKELSSNTKLKQIDITPAIADVLSHKDSKEQKNVRTAATISAFVLKNTLVPELETIIDENQKIKHISLAEKTEKIFEDPSKISKKLSKDHVDSCYTPIIQSGGNYSLKPNAVSDETFLQFGTILCSLGAKYKSYCSNVARTYLVDPIASQNEVYQLCFDIQQVLITSMKSGVKLSSLYNKAIDMIKSHKPELVEKFSKNCGSGIGLEFRETLYTISEKCDHVIKPGMCFNLALGFENIEMPSGSKYNKYSIFLADTILIKDDGEAEVLTEKAPKKLADITYYLENEAANANSAPVKSEEEKPKPKAKPIPTTLSQIVESKFRESTIQRKEEKEKLKEAEEKRREHQRMLEEKQKEEAVARFNTQVKKTSRHEDTRNVEAYKDLSQYPKDLPRSKLFIDTQREVIFLPIYGLMVPFHISTIKNASKTEDCLRLNFVTPDSTLNVAAKSEPIKHPKAIRIKEITYKMPDQKELNNSLRLIKELRKRMNVRETEKRESANLIAQEKLVLSKGRNPRLADVFVRPNPVGRRSNGVLEAHTNGFRFNMNKGETIDILFHNIKQAFFQPAERELIILVHFHLHNPIMVGKKKTQDVQFCTEVMEVSQALDGRRYDADELEDEQRERQMRARLNTEFQNFVKRVEEASGLEFDIPYRDLGFHGVPHRSSVFLQPTVHCLVNLTETPFFVLSLDDLEIAYFERVQFSLKNFDLVFVFKDYSKPVCHINSIAVESLDTIKEWLDQCDIKYYEGTQNLNWQRIMATIADDPVKFHSEDGGWAFLNPDSDDEAEKMEDAAESDFEPENDEEENYGEDDDDEDQYSENSDEDEFQEEDDDDDEGEDWDTLEAKAREQDERRDEKKRSRGDYSDSDEEERRGKAGTKKKKR